MIAASAPYPFADLALARRLERAEGRGNAEFVEARARVSPDSGACWIEVAGAYANYDGALAVYPDVWTGAVPGGDARRSRADRGILSRAWRAGIS